ncbi:hypothetical protein PV10_07254 [Exophiala mesophila]|uniref:aromatic-amino-acid transaminase n=1 Tax=Exophiala mesophila TaxID=212818 RepID=A0A0D1Z7H0_EXOME|nr:uncharacterized protein PV10_07254 [Exophiala mesophila]KIV89894.1 hypothetical protein PV10_07254 [Exophiala mesophila]
MAPHADVEPVTDTSSVVVPDPVLVKGEVSPRFGIDDVFPLRQKNPPLSTIVASFSSAHMFKSKNSANRPAAKRWDHRISTESKLRQASSLKGAMKYFNKDTISLCGGLPSPEYFPFHQVSAKTPVAPHFAQDQVSEAATFSSGKYDTKTDDAMYDLHIALNYGQSMGPGALMRFVTEHTEIVHDPPYSDWDICMTAGSTSALDISLRMFVEKGHYVITEEYSFSSAIETILPMGAKLLGIKMDADGMLPDHLDDLLSNWDPQERQAPKPFVVYTVPTGQNPTASTQSLQRRKALYAIAEKHDLFILEDEPYYFLQMDPYVQGHVHTTARPFKPAPVKEFLQNLTPSYLSLDTSGRVLRLDSFSKIIAPGSRCGWVTGSSQVIERFLRHSEVSAQTPSGFALVTLYNLLEVNWGHKGFLEWLMYIRSEYTRRRDVIVNACDRYLPSQVASWTPPKAGMFHWIKLDVTKHPLYTEKGFTVDEILDIEHRVFETLAHQGTLCAKGSWFRAQRKTDTELFIRLTFAAASEEQMIQAVEKIGGGLRVEFGLPAQSAMNGHAK